MAELIRLGPWTYSGYSGSLVLNYTETPDAATNTSDILVNVTFPGNRTATQYGDGIVVTVGSYSWTVVAKDKSASSSLNASKHFTVPHNSDGTGSVQISMKANMTNEGAKSSTRTVTLTTIPRGNQFTLDKTMLTSGQSVTLTIAKYVDDYKSTVNWERSDGASGQILLKDARTSKEITYAELASGLPSGVSTRVTFTCDTWNGTEYIASTQLVISLSSGNIAASLYDDKRGNVGVTIGERATKSGVNVYTDAAFGKEGKDVNVDYSHSFSKGRFEKLWSQSATSLGQTTINVDLSNFEAIVIVTTTGTYYNFALTTRIDGVWQGDTHKTKVTEQQAGRMVARYFSVFEDHIVVGAGYRTGSYGNSNTTTDNAQVVPVAILGVH